MLHRNYHHVVRNRMTQFHFIHRHAIKGPIISLIASNFEAAMKKLENHVPNAHEWRRPTIHELTERKTTEKEAALS